MYISVKISFTTFSLGGCAVDEKEKKAIDSLFQSLRFWGKREGHK